jgi:hypothetical protein
MAAPSRTRRPHALVIMIASRHRMVVGNMMSLSDRRCKVSDVVQPRPIAVKLNLAGRLHYARRLSSTIAMASCGLISRPVCAMEKE